MLDLALEQLGSVEATTPVVVRTDSAAERVDGAEFVEDVLAPGRPSA
jgi:hypothetical protein